MYCVVLLGDFSSDISATITWSEGLRYLPRLGAECVCLSLLLMILSYCLFQSSLAPFYSNKVYISSTALDGSEVWLKAFHMWFSFTDVFWNKRNRIWHQIKSHRAKMAQLIVRYCDRRFWYLMQIVCSRAAVNQIWVKVSVYAVCMTILIMNLFKVCCHVYSFSLLNVIANLLFSLCFHTTSYLYILFYNSLYGVFVWKKHFMFV